MCSVNAGIVVVLMDTAGIAVIQQHMIAGINGLPVPSMDATGVPVSMDTTGVPVSMDTTEVPVSMDTTGIAVKGSKKEDVVGIK